MYNTVEISRRPRPPNMTLSKISSSQRWIMQVSQQNLCIRTIDSICWAAGPASCWYATAVWCLDWNGHALCTSQV